MKQVPIKFLIISICLGCIQSDMTVVTKLPKSLNEVSGIALDTKDNLFWMINDSGNKPVLYGVDQNGEIQKKIKIDAKNKDWEDLTTDNKGNIYIGDFGNNLNKRKDLRILKLKHNDLKKESVEPVKISFYYPDQEKFPPKKSKQHYDCEAFFFFNEHLYLFTKSRAQNDPGLTKLYKIPAKKGNHKAEYIGSFNTCNEKGCRVTSADINKAKNKIVLLTQGGVFIFSKFKEDHFFEGTSRSFKFMGLTQKESVLFKNDSTLYIADEKTSNHGGYLYEFSIK